MADPAPGLADKVVALHQALTALVVPHAFGGAIALAYYGEPRVTIDIDVNVFVAPEHARAVLDAIESLGITIVHETNDLIERDGQVRVWWGETAVDLFVAYDAFHDAAASRVRTVPFRDASIPILAATDLLVCKAVFDRPKDRIDIEQMLFATPNGIDLTEARSWVRRIVGHDDARAGRLDATITIVLGSEPLEGS